jgi:hypothetical protein
MGSRIGASVKWLLVVASVAGVVGVGMALAGVHSPARAVLVVVFLAVVPTVAIAGLLRSFDLFARIILAGAATITILTLTATIMLAEGVWSPVAGLLGVTVATLLCLVAQWPPVRERVGTAVASRWPAVHAHTSHTGSIEQPQEV